MVSALAVRNSDFASISSEKMTTSLVFGADALEALADRVARTRRGSCCCNASRRVVKSSVS